MMDARAAPGAVAGRPADGAGCRPASQRPRRSARRRGRSLRIRNAGKARRMVAGRAPRVESAAHGTPRSRRSHGAHPHRPGGRHPRHLAALSLPPRSGDGQRRHRPPGLVPRRDRRDGRPPRVEGHAREGGGPRRRRRCWAEARWRSSRTSCARSASRRASRVVTQSRVPAGSGLGGSSALAVTIAAAAAAAFGRPLDADALWPIVRDAEAQAIAVPTGIQDYLAAIHGGVLGIELRPGAVCGRADRRRSRTRRGVPAARRRGRDALLGDQQLGRLQGTDRRGCPRARGARRHRRVRPRS